MLKEFKEFALKGNVLDMAIGVIIATSFAKIVSSLVSDIIMPPIGLLTGGVDFSDLSITLKQGTDTSLPVTLNYGLFINNVIDFLIISFVIFLVVKQLNKFMKKEKKEAEEKVSKEVKLLEEIRDVLKNK